MSGGWQFVLSQPATQTVLSLRKTERGRVVAALEQLTNNPYLKPDARGKSKDGRDYFVKYAGQFSIAYWHDAFVKELRVVNIERLHRA